jgi:hypothetical protein
MSGLLQAWEEMDPAAERVLIRVIMKRFSTTTEDNPNVGPHLTKNILRQNGVKGVLAAWTYFQEHERVEWKRTLFGAKVLARGDAGTFVLTEAVFADMLSRVDAGETDEESSDDGTAGTMRRKRERKKLRQDIRKKARAAESRSTKQQLIANGNPQASAKGVKRKRGRPRKHKNVVPDCKS